MKKNFKKLLLVLFMAMTLTQSIAVLAATPDAQDIAAINSDGKGLVPECAHLGPDGSVGEECQLDDLFGMIRPLRDILIYGVILVVVGYTLYAGVGLAFYGDVPEYREKLKKILKNGVIAIIIMATAASLIFAILVSLGFSQDALDIVKKIFSFNDFNIFPHALAQSASSTPANSTQYVNLFPKETFISLIQKTIKFLISYIVAPILTIGIIIAGFRFVKAEGNPEELAKAKKFGTWMLIGIAVSIMTPLLLNMVLSTIQDVIGADNTSSETKKTTIQNDKANTSKTASGNKTKDTSENTDDNTTDNRTQDNPVNTNNNTIESKTQDTPVNTEQNNKKEYTKDEVLSMRTSKDINGNPSYLIVEVKPTYKDKYAFAPTLFYGRMKLAEFKNGKEVDKTTYDISLSDFENDSLFSSDNMVFKISPINIEKAFEADIKDYGEIYNVKIDIELYLYLKSPDKKNNDIAATYTFNIDGTKN